MLRYGGGVVTVTLMRGRADNLAETSFRFSQESPDT